MHIMCLIYVRDQSQAFLHVIISVRTFVSDVLELISLNFSIHMAHLYVRRILGLFVIASVLQMTGAWIESVKNGSVDWDVLALESDIAHEIEAIEDEARSHMNSLIERLGRFQNRTTRQIERIKSGIHDLKVYYPDCEAIYDACIYDDGVYTIYPDESKPGIDVYCEFSDDGSWLVFQRRQDGSVMFSRTWDEYAQGFGNLAGEHWLGNRHLNVITNAKDYMLRIDLTDWDDVTRQANYSLFRVADEQRLFELRLGRHRGTARNSMLTDSGSKFSTIDRDNDRVAGEHKARDDQGAWWYTSRTYARLNNPYSQQPAVDNWKGIIWFHWRGRNYSLKATQMKIRPIRTSNGQDRSKPRGSP